METIKNKKIIILFLIIIFLGFLSKKINNETFQNINESYYTIYGSLNCGWTVKQLNYFKNNNKKYKFIDCDKNFDKCNYDGYPVTFDKNGKRFDLEFTRNTIKQAILTEYPLEDDSAKVLKKLENLIEQK